jgi:hypothetical protein
MSAAETHLALMPALLATEPSGFERQFSKSLRTPYPQPSFYSKDLLLLIYYEILSVSPLLISALKVVLTL